MQRHVRDIGGARRVTDVRTCRRKKNYMGHRATNTILWFSSVFDIYVRNCKKLSCLRSSNRVWPLDICHLVHQLLIQKWTTIAIDAAFYLTMSSDEAQLLCFCYS